MDAPSAPPADDVDVHKSALAPSGFDSQFISRVIMFGNAGTSFWEWGKVQDVIKCGTCNSPLGGGGICNVSMGCPKPGLLLSLKFATPYSIPILSIQAATFNIRLVD
jgi:hypothetical protein